MAPFWVFDQGPAKVERLVPLLPFSKEAQLSHGCVRHSLRIALRSDNHDRKN